MTEPKRGDSSPWGAIQDVVKHATGIIQVHTASHGGVWLSGARLREMKARAPALLELADFYSGGNWFEEDLEMCRVILAFPEYFKEAQVVSCVSSLINTYPDMMAKHLGREIDPAESYALRRRNFLEENKGRYIVTSASGDWADWVPAGMVGVAAVIDEDRTRPASEYKWFLVPKTEYELRDGALGFVIDPERHQEIANPENRAPTKQVSPEAFAEAIGVTA